MIRVAEPNRTAFVTVECADDYYESIDIDTAMHPAISALLRNVRPGQLEREARRTTPSQYVPTKHRLQGRAKYVRTLGHFTYWKKAGYWGEPRVLDILSL